MMNQLETNLVLWAICSIILLEILLIICLCRCFFNRIKPKRFYVKREECEYLHSTGGTPSQFPSTILRPPHADELALVGTIRDQKPTLNFDHGIQNPGYYRNEDNDEEFLPTVSSVLATSPYSSEHFNWMELRSSQRLPSSVPPLLSNPIIINDLFNTAPMPSADYEGHSCPVDSYMHINQSIVHRPATVDFRHYRDEYDDNEQPTDGKDDVLDRFHCHYFRQSDAMLSHIQRTDTSTESFGGTQLTHVPKSILKSSSSITPPLDLMPVENSQVYRSRTSSKFDESPRISVKINTDQSILIGCPTSAIERIIPDSSISLNNVLMSSLSRTNRMRFASVSQLNDVEWEVPDEFQTILYDLVENRVPAYDAFINSSNENLNNNNNINLNSREKLSNRQRSQSANIDQRTYISRVFVPWSREKKSDQFLYLSNDNEQSDTTQQKALEY